MNGKWPAIVFAAGCVAPWPLAALGAVLRIGPDQTASNGLADCVVLTGFLFVPASIFAPAVGAMFPNYWNATPVTIIASRPFQRLLWLLLLAIGYVVSSIGVSLLWQTTWLVLAPMLVLAGVGGFLAVRLVAYSLVIFDPVQLAHAIAGTPPMPNQDPSVTAANDLCRFIRGLVERGRPDAAADAIDQLRGLWKREGAKLAEARRLTDQVLAECDGRYPGRTRIQSAVDACKAALPE